MSTDTGRIITVGTRALYFPRRQPLLHLSKIVGYETKSNFLGLRGKVTFTFAEFTRWAAQATTIKFML